MSDNNPLEPTHQERLDRAIYLHYVQTRMDTTFKHVSKEVFYNKLYADKLERVKFVSSDKNRIYRLSDNKEIWHGKYGTVLGEVWCDDEDNVKSYWINRIFL